MNIVYYYNTHLNNNKLFIQIYTCQYLIIIKIKCHSPDAGIGVAPLPAPPDCLRPPWSTTPTWERLVWGKSAALSSCIDCWPGIYMCRQRKCNLISLFNLLAFPFNIILIVCAILDRSSATVQCFIIEIYCAQNRVFLCDYLTVILLNKDAFIHSQC